MFQMFRSGFLHSGEQKMSGVGTDYRLQDLKLYRGTENFERKEQGVGPPLTAATGSPPGGAV